MKRLKFIFCCVLALVTLNACGSKNNGSGDSTKAVTPNLKFYESDGVCFDGRTNERVASSNCSSLKFALDNGRCIRESDNDIVNMNSCTTNTYFMGNSGCYNRSGQIVDERRCLIGSNSTNPTTGNGRRHVCSGPHLQFLEDDILEGNCDGIANTGNCSGVVLFDIEEQQWVDCL